MKLATGEVFDGRNFAARGIGDIALRLECLSAVSIAGLIELCRAERSGRAAVPKWLRTQEAVMDLACRSNLIVGGGLAMQATIHATRYGKDVPAYALLSYGTEETPLPASRSWTLDSLMSKSAASGRIGEHNLDNREQIAAANDPLARCWSVSRILSLREVGKRYVRDVRRTLRFKRDASPGFHARERGR